MDYRERIKLLIFIKEVMTTSDESRKYIYGLLSNPEEVRLGYAQLSKKLVDIEEKYGHRTTVRGIYTPKHLNLLLRGINAYNEKEESGHLVKLMMSLLLVKSKDGIISKQKDGILSKHTISATIQDFTVESSSGLFSKNSHHLTAAMLEYVISNGAKKLDSKGNIPKDVVDKLIENTLLFHSSKNSHDKFMQISGITSINSIEEMASTLKAAYKIQGNVPQYITDLAYSFYLGNITLSRKDRLIITYTNRDKQTMRVNIDLCDHKLFLNRLLRGEGISRTINSFVRTIVQKA